MAISEALRTRLGAFTEAADHVLITSDTVVANLREMGSPLADLLEVRFEQLYFDAIAEQAEAVKLLEADGDWREAVGHMELAFHAMIVARDLANSFIRLT